MATAPAVVRPLHFAGLDAIAEALEELQLHALEARAFGSDQLLDFDYGRLERQLSAFLSPRPSWEDLRHLTFSFANVTVQHAVGEPLSPEYLIQSAPIALPSSVRNTAETVGHPVAQRTPPSPANDEFVGMTEYVAESFHDLHGGESKSPFNSNSSMGAITPLVNVSW